MILRHARVGGELKTIVTEGGRIALVTDRDMPEGVDVGGKRVIPGLIDVHTHGANGFDTMDADFAPLCRFYAQHGTTAFLPTTMTMPYADILRVTTANTACEGAQILGFHLEGPFISEKHKGAQDPANIRMPSVTDFAQFQNVKMVTMAPELPGSEEFIRAVSDRTVVSIGHTDCDYETALRAIDCGANCLTHTYNAMPPLHHRAPGPIGAGFERHIYAQLICDGFHVAPTVIRATWQLFGTERMVIISDSIRTAGLPDGEYVCGGCRFEGRCGTADGRHDRGVERDLVGLRSHGNKKRHPLRGCRAHGVRDAGAASRCEKRQDRRGL